MKKSYFLMLMALAFMFSCRTENMDENNLQKNLEKTSQAKFITKTVSLSGKDEIVKRSNILHAFKNNKTNTAELDYKHVEYIETVGKKTYTFKILNSDAPGSFQNLVIIQYPDGTIKKKIITYSASENEKQSMLMGNMVNFSGKVISVTDLDDAAPNNTQGKYYESGGKCYSESIEVSPCGSGQHNASNMDQWDKCTHPVKAKLIVTVEEVPCGSGGSSSTGTGTDYGNDTQNPDNGGIDFPTAPTLTNLQFILFVNTLPQNLQDVVNNVDYLDFYTGLNNYFYYSNKTAAAKAFITWALQFKLANPDTSWEQFQNWFLNSNVDVNILNDVKNYITENNYTIPVYNSISYPGKQDGMPFEWWKDNTWIKNNIRIDENNPNEEPNSTELMLFGVYPLQASFHIKNSKNALNLANQLVTNGKYTHIHNGKADAFRHTFWNALDSADFGKKITLLFTKAHEVGSSNHPLETEMDLHNNEQGAQLGTNYSTFTSSNTIKDAVINMMDNSSNIWYLSPLADHDGNNILSNTQIKPTN